MVLVLNILALASLALLLFEVNRIRVMVAEENYKIRGFLKYYNQQKFNEKINRKIQTWLYLAGICFLLFQTIISYITWNTDFNFFIALFPFIWHYFFFRYFLWEKTDLAESK